MIRTPFRAAALLCHFCLTATLAGAKPAPTWVRETERAGWQPRDSQGEAVFDGRM